MGVRRNVLPRFLLLYGTLYGSFGLSSPFLPAFLAARGVGPEALGLLLGAGTAVRLRSAPLAGRLADVFGAFRLELVLFAISAAMVSLLYLPAHWFWMLALVNLTQAAMLAPLVPRRMHSRYPGLARPHVTTLEPSNMAGCEAQAPLLSLPGSSLLDKR